MFLHVFCMLSHMGMVLLMPQLHSHCHLAPCHRPQGFLDIFVAAPTVASRVDLLSVLVGYLMPDGEALPGRVWISVTIQMHSLVSVGSLQVTAFVGGYLARRALTCTHVKLCCITAKSIHAHCSGSASAV